MSKTFDNYTLSCLHKGYPTANQISNSFCLSSFVTCAYTLSKYFFIYAYPLFLANYTFIGIFMSICEYTLTSMELPTSTILVAVSTISPLTLLGISA